MELNRKAAIYNLIAFIIAIIMAIFYFSGIRIGFYITMILLILLTYPIIKAGRPFLPKAKENLLYEDEEGAVYEDEEGISYEDKESLLYKYMRYFDKHPIIITFAFFQVVFLAVTVSIIQSGIFEWGTYLLIIFIVECCTAIGIIIGLYIKNKGIA